VLLGFFVGFGYSALQAGLSVCCECPRVCCVVRAGAFNTELVGVDDVSVMILCTKLILKPQGYKIEKNILYQDNKSAILLEENGKKSSGKRTPALNIPYFFLTDQVQKGNVMIIYCRTDGMVGDFHTKPLQGKKFCMFNYAILGS
jgi:hypothetical protein